MTLNNNIREHDAQENSLQVVSCTLHDLLSCSEKNIPETELCGQLTIPEYQRPYVWKEKQINQLLNDFYDYHLNEDEHKPLYYLGSIILHNDNGKLNIIDGQQRITTALLIEKIINPSFTSGIKYSSGVSIQNIKRNLGYLKSVKAKDIFEYREIDVIDYIDFKQVNITLIITATEDLAYTFFETQNTGGVRLDGSDVLKAHHLRAIDCKKTINYQAKKWESIDNYKVEYIVQLLTKIRFWDNRKWRQFPFYKDTRGIKEVLIDEYTLNTTNTTEDVSYYYSAVKNEDGRQLQMHESTFKQLKQPLANGNNTLDYINDYIELYNLLFVKSVDHRIDDRFYEFRNAVIHGKDGTLFLKELFEIAMISYVSRFGYFRLYEACLWLYRAIYSLRVSNRRNVREDSLFKFVFDNQFIDNIIEVFTPDELFLFLKKFNYTFNPENAEEGKSKGKHVFTLNNYFPTIKNVAYYQSNPKDFDKHFVIAISNLIN